MAVLRVDTSTAQPVTQNVLQGDRHPGRGLASAYGYHALEGGQVERGVTHLQRIALQTHKTTHALFRIHRLHRSLKDIGRVPAHTLRREPAHLPRSSSSNTAASCISFSIAPGRFSRIPSIASRADMPQCTR